MNLWTMKKVCAAYHNKTVAELTDAATDVDLFLVAVNNARKNAERNHNFESTWAKGVLSVAPTTGGALSAVTITPADIFSGVREIIEFEGIGQSGVRYPLVLKRAGAGLTSRYISRYPTDQQVFSGQWACAYLILRGDNIYKYPDDGTGSALSVEMELYGWLNDYTDDDLVEAAAVPDFLVEHGFEYLQWAVILELNYSFQTFVFRQEGNPGAPEKKLAAAWESLVNWDSYRASTRFKDER